MADLQKQFRKFHDTIAIDYEKGVLAQKRQRILDRLREGIAKQRKDGVPVPRYRHRNQGSYAMGTGIKPIDEDYDLDVALIFDTTRAHQPNPLVVKGWVFDAIQNHTKEVRVREPCVTVFYSQKGEIAYHVDFAIYVEESGHTYLARGKPGAGTNDRSWEESDLEGLLQLITNVCSHQEDRAQFRRSVRYLKRWKDVVFAAEGNEAPRGIALTACAYHWFAPCVDIDALAAKRTYDDHGALQHLVDTMRSRFSNGRLAIEFPTAPCDDLFREMSADQMKNFENKLAKLAEALGEAKKTVDPHQAATLLAGVFGSDFPVPAKTDTATKTATAAIVSSGHSG